MKRLSFSSALFLLFTSVLSAQALEFDIFNYTGVDLYGIYVAPAESDDWGEDILPKDRFSNNSQVKVRIPHDFGETCSFDILLTIDEAEESSITFTGADLCEIISISLYEDGYYEVVLRE